MIQGGMAAVARLPRWMLAVTDQGLVAIVNLSLSIVVTQIAGVSALGLFAIVNTTILLTLGVSRLLVSDPWLASRTAPPEADGRLRMLVLACAIGTALVTAVVVLVAAGGQPRWYIACVVAFALVLQDFGRYTAFKSEQPLRAVRSDLTVLLVGALVFGSLALAGRGGLTELLVAWAIGTIAGAAVAVRWSGLTVTAHGTSAYWVRHCRPLASKLALDTTAYLLAVNGSLYLLAYLGTQQDVGLVRIVQTVFSPAALVVTGLTMWLVPYLASHSGSTALDARRRATTWLVLGSVPLVILAVLVGPWFITLVFGVSPPPGTVPLLLGGVATLAMAVSAPWVASARVTGHYLPIAWARGLGAVITWAGMIAVAGLRSTNGYLGLLALQSVLVRGHVDRDRRAGTRRGAGGGVTRTGRCQRCRSGRRT